MDDMEKVTDLWALYKAYRKVMSGKRDKPAALRFATNAMEGLCVLRWNLRAMSYKMGEYSCFSVERPVHRDVKSCAFQDKIVLGSLCKNVLWEKIDPHLIEDNYASRKGYGTHYAIDRLEESMRRHYIKYGLNGYVLRMDARKYFYNLVHDAMKADLRRYGLDEWTIWLCSVIIDSSSHSFKNGYVTTDAKGRAHVVFCDLEGSPTLEIGAPIGNETSQVFAVQYLDLIDHYIKDQCGVKEYRRYMDDSCIIHPSKEYLQNLLEGLKRLYAERGLEFNQKTEIYPLKNGVKFLGMHLYLTETGKVVRRLNPKNIKYARVHIRENAELVAKGKMTVESYWRRFDAMDNHMSYADAKKLRRKMRHYAEEALNNAFEREQRKLGEIAPNIDDVPGGTH